ncbi:MAG: DTW domain-containing protein [Burkholderiales bacterium]|nr:MAG: DTW domain-containing protein [Burkholderiales bacterium]
MPRAVCPRCERPARTCLCGILPAPLPNRTELLILQHPAEVGHAKNTATLLALGLQRVRLLRGKVFDPGVAGPGSALLYPGVPPAAARPGDVQCLVLLDGSWRQSRRLLVANPWLQALPRLSLPALASRYAIRAAHRPGQLATLEAGLHALALLGAGEASLQPLWMAFDQFVAASLARRSRVTGQP